MASSGSGCPEMVQSMTKVEAKTIFDIPIELFENIILYTSYDQIAQMRQVNKFFNVTCSKLLNRGFLMVEKYHSQSLKRVKSQLPRRESERRNHALARHCDVLSAIETRLSLLSMTFSKFIDLNLCCFIPGKVIDEIYRVLRFINNNPSPPRVHELLQELRDISSMAMEYFEEKVAPNLKQRLLSSRPLNCPVMSPSIAKMVRQVQPLASVPSTSRTEKDDESKIRKDMKAIQASSKREVQELRAKLLEMEKRQKEQNQAMFEMQTRIADQEIRIQELTSKSKESIVSLPSEAQSPRVRVGPKRCRTKVSRLRKVLDEEPCIRTKVLRSRKVPDEGPCTRTRSKRAIETNRGPQIKRTRQ